MSSSEDLCSKGYKIGASLDCQFCRFGISMSVVSLGIFFGSFHCIFSVCFVSFGSFGSVVCLTLILIFAVLFYYISNHFLSR